MRKISLLHSETKIIFKLTRKSRLLHVHELSKNM